MNARALLTAICLSSISVSAGAAELRAADIRASVLEHFPLVLEAAKKAEAADKDAMSSEGEFDFKLKVKAANRYDDVYDYRHLETSAEKRLQFSGMKLSVGHLQGLGDIPAYTGKYETPSAGEAFVGLSIPLLRDRAADQERYSLTSNRLNFEASRKELALKKNTYIHKALSTFQKWRLSYQKVAIKKGLLDQAIERQKMLSRRHLAGDVEQLRLVDNERGINKREEELLELQIDFETIGRLLGLYYRDEQGRPIDLTGVTPASEAVNDIDLQLKKEPSNLPQLGIIDAETEMARASLKFGESQRLPRLNLDATGYHRLETSPSYGPSRLQVGLYFEIPLENRKGRGKEEAARAKLAALDQRRTYFLDEVQNSLEQLRSTIEITKKRIQVIEKELKNAKQVAEAERRRLLRGDADLFVVMLREQDVADVEIKLRSSEYRLAQAQLDARLIMGEI